MSSDALGFIALLLVASAAALWFLAMHRVAIPADRSAFVAAWLGGALLGVAALAGDAGWPATIAGALAVIAGSFFLFTVSISRQRVDDDAIRVGDPLPAFSAPDEHGGNFDSASLAGHPTLIKFFRGHW